MQTSSEESFHSSGIKVSLSFHVTLVSHRDPVKKLSIGSIPSDGLCHPLRKRMYDLRSSAVQGHYLPQILVFRVTVRNLQTISDIDSLSVVR